MKKILINDICEMEFKFCQIVDLLKVLKDAVENNDDTYYLLTYIELLCEKAENFADFLEENNQKISKII